MLTALLAILGWLIAIAAIRRARTNAVWATAAECEADAAREKARQAASKAFEHAVACEKAEYERDTAECELEVALARGRDADKRSLPAAPHRMADPTIVVKPYTGPPIVLDLPQLLLGDHTSTERVRP